MRRAFLLLTFAATAASAGSHTASDQIEVTDPDEVVRLVELESAISDLTDLVSQCVAAGGEAAACLCSNADRHQVMRASLDRLLDRRPEWEDRALFVRDTGDGQSLTLWLDVAREMAQNSDCR